MAKISELVKTYRFLNDPNAPDWNLKFVGGIVIALGLIAAAGGIIWSASQRDAPDAAPAAATTDAEPPGDLAACEPTEVAEAMKRAGSTSIPAGTTLPSGCVVP